MGMAESGLEEDVPLNVQCMIPCITYTQSQVHLHCDGPCQWRVFVFWSVSLTPLHVLRGRWLGIWTLLHKSRAAMWLWLWPTDGRANKSEHKQLSCLLFRVPSDLLQKTYFQSLKRQKKRKISDHVTKFFKDCCTNVYRSVLLYVRCWTLGDKTTKPHSCLSPSLSRSSAGRWGTHSVLCFMDVFREFHDFFFFFFNSSGISLHGFEVSLNRLHKSSVLLSVVWADYFTEACLTLSLFIELLIRKSVIPLKIR